MTVTAPPRPPQAPRPRDAVERPDPEALIEEARQRARRRRCSYGAGATALALIGVSIFVAFGPSEPSPSAASQASTAPVAAVDETELVAHWERIHVGYVLVYADGRVIWNPDSLIDLERRLTLDGLDLVRSGAIQLKAFLDDDDPSLASLWAEPERRTYEPSRYALCDQNFRPITARALDGFPAETQAWLRDKQRTYDHGGLFLGSPASVECFEISAAEADALADTGEDVYISGDHMYFPQLDLVVYSILPHGEWVIWGG